MDGFRIVDCGFRNVVIRITTFRNPQSTIRNRLGRIDADFFNFFGLAKLQKEIYFCFFVAFLLETSEIFFRLKKRGAERDDFDFLIFFLKKKIKKSKSSLSKGFFESLRREMSLFFLIF
jgi:hypothetical protein